MAEVRGHAPAVDAVAVTKRFGGRGRSVTALHEVSFALAAGEVVAVMGDNGAGKSTLLDLVCGLTDPTEGRLRVLGREPRGSVLAGDVAAMLQTGGLLPELTVAETVGLAADLFGRRDRLTEVLARTGLDRIAGRRIAVCSGGERQRVKFAMALLPRAPLLVLDEPTAGMDWGARVEFWDGMRAMAADGATLVYATHYADEVEGIADRVLVLSAGRLVADASVSRVREAAGTRRVTARVPGGRFAHLVSLPEDATPAWEGEVLTVDVPRGSSDRVCAELLGAGARDLTVTDPPLFAGLAALTEGDAPTREEGR